MASDDEQDEQQQAPSVPVDNVSIKLPPFLPKNLQFWFGTVEAQFGIRGITKDDTKFWHLISALDTESFGAVAAVVEAVNDGSLTDNKYKTAKNALLESYSDSPMTQFFNFLRASPQSDRSVVEIFHRIKSIRVTMEDAQMAAALFALPSHIQQQLASRDFSNIKELQSAAKKIESQGPVPVASIRSSKQKRPQQSDSRSSKPTKDLCFYHRKFGKNARRCKPPCSLSHTVASADWDVEPEGSGNALGSH